MVLKLYVNIYEGIVETYNSDLRIEIQILPIYAIVSLLSCRLSD